MDWNYKIQNFIIFWLPPILWMGFLFPLTNGILSSNSTSHFIVPILKWFLPDASQATINTLHILFRKSVHFGEYAFLAFLLFWAFRGNNRKSWNLKWFTYAGVVTLGYGILDEFLQAFMSSRTGSVFDLMIDSAGAIFALGIISLKVWQRQLTLTVTERQVRESGKF